MAVCVYNLPQVAAGSVQYDGLEVHYSAQQYLSAELHSGRLPFWTPYIFSGFPFLADPQVGAWYPLNWPLFLVGVTPRSINLELLVHCLVAATGAYFLARRLLGNPGAAALVGILYALSGWFAAHSQHVGMFDTASWLPWLMLLLLTLQDGITSRKLALAALIGSAIMLPGSFQLALYTFFFVGLWALLQANRWPMLIGLVAAGLWGGLLSAVMILPGLELASQSVRTRLDALALPDIGYFHFGSLVTLVYPNYYGLLSGPYHGPGDSTQHYFYAGILLLPLVIVGLRNLEIARPAALLGLPFLAYALGPRWGVYQVLARLPGFSSLELPMHGWFLPALGLALLGGAGAIRLPRRWLPFVTAITLVDVLVVNQLLNPLAYARDNHFEAALAAFADLVSASPVPVERVYGPPLASVGYRNHGLQSRIETTYGYNPLELASYADFAAAAHADPALIAGFAATHEVTPDGHLHPASGALPLAYFPSGSGTATVNDRSEDTLTVHYVSPTAQVLRVAIPLYPGWTATLQGNPLLLTPTDGAFIGVEVPAGQGDVRMAYRSRFFGMGAAISGLALILALMASCAQPGRARTLMACGPFSWRGSSPR